MLSGGPMPSLMGYRRIPRPSDSKKAPRLPPTSWEETATLLTTYALFLEMLFGSKHEHLKGVDCVQRELMGMARIKQKLSTSYYANMIWEILDDMCKHFNEYMSLDDFQNARFSLIWLQTDLRGFTQQMRASQ